MIEITWNPYGPLSVRICIHTLRSAITKVGTMQVNSNISDLFHMRLSSICEEEINTLRASLKNMWGFCLLICFKCPELKGYWWLLSHPKLIKLKSRQFDWLVQDCKAFLVQEGGLELKYNALYTMLSHLKVLCWSSALEATGIEAGNLGTRLEAVRRMVWQQVRWEIMSRINYITDFYFL